MIRSLQIVDHDNYRFDAGAVSEHRPHTLEQDRPVFGGRGRRRKREVRETHAQLGDELRNVGSASADQRLKVRGIRPTKKSAQHLHPRPERRRAVALVAATPQHPRALRASVRGHLLGDV